MQPPKVEVRDPNPGKLRLAEPKVEQRQQREPVTHRLGHGETLRGVSFGRWRAPDKAVANVELRWTVFGLHPGDHEVLLELAPFGDAGTVWGGGDATDAEVVVHPAAGGGARVVFDRTFVGRADAGFSPDPERASDGTISAETAFGFYLTFEHPF